jgi:hypothetical protein
MFTRDESPGKTRTNSHEQKNGVVITERSKDTEKSESPQDRKPEEHRLLHLLAYSKRRAAVSTYSILPHSNLDIIGQYRKKVNDPEECFLVIMKLADALDGLWYSQIAQFRNEFRLLLRARHLAIYSTVNKATMLVSKPNQTRPEMAWKAGTVSNTVTSEDSTMRKVMKTWMKKAGDELVGRSRSL